MPNDYLSLWPSSRRSARFCTTLESRAAKVACVVLIGVASPSCGGDSDTSVTYEDDIQPLFNRRCNTCHHPSSPIGVDIQNPFAPGRGLVNSANSWYLENPAGNLPPKNVTPFEPENSFLMNKLTGELPVNGSGGEAMPAQIAPVTEQELAVLEQWVTDGAQPGPYFEDNVRPIFGREDIDRPGGSVLDFYGGKCIFCHYSNSPNPLDLSDPFGPDGLVNVPASYRANTVRVVPGSPDDSLLILKVRAVRPDSDIGAQMPYSFNPLTTEQVDIVRQWIVEGARP